MRTTLSIALAVLSLVAMAYFALMIWRAPTFADVLLEHGYQERGWTAEKLARRIRLLAGVGAALGLVGLAVALVRLFG